MHVWCIHDQVYIQRRTTIHPFQIEQQLWSSNEKAVLVDNTVLKATLLCVWKGELYRITMALILFYNWSILLLLLCCCTVRDCRVCCCCCRCCCCYTVQDSRGCCCCTVVVVVIFPYILLFRCIIIRIVRRYTATMLLLLNCTDMLLLLLLLLLLLYRTAVSIQFDSFSLHGSFACRCNKINK